MKKLAIPNTEWRLRLPAVGRDCGIYPVRNNVPLGFESQRLEFLTGFTLSIRSRINIDIKFDYAL